MAAFEQLYRAHAAPLMSRVIRPRTGTEADAEDVLVDTFRTALEMLDRFRWMGRSFFSWLARIAANKCVDVARAGKSRAGAVERFAAEPGDDGDALRPDRLVLAQAEREHLGERVGVVMGELNPRYARALQLRLLDGLERAECAERMEVRIGTFDVVLLRAVRAFRKRWAQRFGEEDIG